MALSAGRTPEGDYFATPSPTTSRGVLVLHAWWGLNPFFESVCDRLAACGFVSLAPDLFHGATASTVEQAEKLRSRFKQGTVALAVAGAAERLRAVCGAEVGRLGVLGFSLGGYYALGLARQPSSPIQATVIFYASSGGDYAASVSAFQFHLAETDRYVSASGTKAMLKAVRAAGREVELYAYPGTTHWFFESNQPSAYDPVAADLAWNRTLQFLDRHLAWGAA